MLCATVMVRAMVLRLSLEENHVLESKAPMKGEWSVVHTSVPTQSITKSNFIYIIHAIDTHMYYIWNINFMTKEERCIAEEE